MIVSVCEVCNKLLFTSFVYVFPLFFKDESTPPLPLSLRHIGANFFLLKFLVFVLCYEYGVGCGSRQELPLDDEENEGPEQAKIEKDPM